MSHVRGGWSATRGEDRDSQADRLSARERAFARKDEQRLRRHGQLAGVMFILGSVLSIPSAFFSSMPVSTIGPLTVLGLASGAICLLLPWQRMSPAWLHAIALGAIAEVTLLVVIGDHNYVLFYLFVAVYIAYVFENRLVIAAYGGLMSLALFFPLVTGANDSHETVQIALLAIPTLLIAAGVVAYLRESLEASRRTYEQFAEEAMQLAGRLRGGGAAQSDGLDSVATTARRSEPAGRLRLRH